MVTLLHFGPVSCILTPSAVPNKNLFNREIAFTLRNEAYLRYNSFSSYQEFKTECVRLNPARFELGPVYTAKVRSLSTFPSTITPSLYAF